MQLSIIIVNYNVRDLLLDAVASLYTAREGIGGEIIVVDNASTDGALEALNRDFPAVITVGLSRNLGFGAANNVGIEMARGEYILLINPDTIVQENTLREMISFMEAHPAAAFAGCKILNPDGSFEPASKRGFPSPWSSFCRVFGLSRLFPRSRLFGGYNLTHLDPDTTSRVDALSGCFMFCRGEILKRLKGFDTDFFMYGEDLDLCFRAKELGGEIHYHPGTSIMHLKGESTRRSSIDALATFYEAMEIFARKHFRSNAPLLWLIRAGIALRRMIARVNERFPSWWLAGIDVAGLLAGLMIGSEIVFGKLLGYPVWALPAVLLLTPLLFVLTIGLAKGYDADDRIPRNAMLGYLMGFFVLSALTYFFPDYRFSRNVVVMTTGLATTIGVCARFLWLLYRRTYGAEAIRRIAFLSSRDPQPEVRNSVRRTFLGRPVSIEGTIAVDYSDAEIRGKVLGTVENIAKIVREFRLTDIFVIDSSMSYGDVISAMSHTTGQPVRYHVVRQGESLEPAAPPATQAHHSTGRPVAYRRGGLFTWLSDRAIAVGLLMTLPIVYLSGGRPASQKRLARDLGGVLVGRRRLVGSGADSRERPLFSVADLCGVESLTERELAQIDTYYISNQSFLLDCEIIVATFRHRPVARGAAVAAGESVGQSLN